jgi:4-amino-4-deoxy-L-arabinose transferase-like glycosyltransferase
MSFTTAYLKVLGERALIAFASTLVSLLGAGATGLLDAPWEQSLSAAGLAALVAVLTSVAGGAVTSSSSPALTSKETETAVEQ